MNDTFRVQRCRFSNCSRGHFGRGAKKKCRQQVKTEWNAVQEFPPPSQQLRGLMAVREVAASFQPALTHTHDSTTYTPPRVSKVVADWRRKGQQSWFTRSLSGEPRSPTVRPTVGSRNHNNGQTGGTTQHLMLPTVSGHGTWLCRTL